MKLNVEIEEREIRAALADLVNDKFGTNFTGENLPIQVKSKQNYKSE